MGQEYIVGLGELLWDVFPDSKKLGGAPCNFAFHVSQLGLAGLGISAAGNDPLGREALEVLDDAGLKYSIELLDHPTGTVDVQLDSAGVASYVFQNDVAWDNMPFTREMEITAMQTRAVCFGTLAQRSEISRTTINRFLDTMPVHKGVYRIFDINLRQDFYSREIIEASLRKSNILKLNDDEIGVVAAMFGYGDDMHDACWKLLESYDLDILILTCGAKGSYVFTPRSITFRDTPEVEVVDTVGAGDAFTAAFVSALLNGRTVEFAHELAVDVSAWVCTQSGAMAPLPDSLKKRLR